MLMKTMNYDCRDRLTSRRLLEGDDFIENIKESLIVIVIAWLMYHSGRRYGAHALKRKIEIG